MQAPPLPLYHYTNFGAFKGIVESRELWATDVGFLNDAKEYRHAVDLVVEELRSARQSLTALEASGFDFLSLMLSEGQYHGTYVFSLSTQDDQLSQWRGYAADGGVAIQFNTDELARLAGNDSFELVECIYNLAHQRAEVKTFVAFCLDVMRRRISEGAATGEELCRHGAYTKNIGPAMNRLAVRLKHKGFAEEQEWRLVSTAEFRPCRIRVRASGSLLVPYVAIPISSAEPESRPNEWPTFETPIASYVLGPNRHMSLAEVGVMNLLLASRLQASITPRRSDIPLRSL